MRKRGCPNILAGEAIVFWRQGVLGWTQRELADRASVCVDTVRNLEREYGGSLACQERVIRTLASAAAWRRPIRFWAVAMSTNLPGQTDD